MSTPVRNLVSSGSLPAYFVVRVQGPGFVSRISRERREKYETDSSIFSVSFVVTQIGFESVLVSGYGAQFVIGFVPPERRKSRISAKTKPPSSSNNSEDGSGTGLASTVKDPLGTLSTENAVTEIEWPSRIMDAAPWQTRLR